MKPALNILPPGHPHSSRRTAAQKKKHRRWPWWRVTLLVFGLGVFGYIAASAAVFFAVKWHVTDEVGAVDPLTDRYTALAADATGLSLPEIPDKADLAARAAERQVVCEVDVLRRVAPVNGLLLDAAQTRGASPATMKRMTFAASLRLPHDSPAAVAFSSCAIADYYPPALAVVTTKNLYPWARAEEWEIISAAFTKDRSTIDRVSRETGVPARLIVSVAAVEQLRLYFTQRELFEKFFRPLKILGNATQFAWGIMSIKEATAIDIERHANSPRSSLYPGPGFSALLALPTKDTEKVRFARLTNEKDHYYSYLYGATELQEFMAQWQRAGFSIESRPEILATLFNIGFSRSKPSATPNVGGSTMTIADTEYTFGGLAFELFYSGELLTDFPPVSPVASQ